MIRKVFQKAVQGTFLPLGTHCWKEVHAENQHKGMVRDWEILTNAHVYLWPHKSKSSQCRSSWLVLRGCICSPHGMGWGRVVCVCSWDNLQCPSHKFLAALLSLGWDLLFQLLWWDSLGLHDRHVGLYSPTLPHPKVAIQYRLSTARLWFLLLEDLLLKALHSWISAEI